MTTKKTTDYAQGYLDGFAAACWTCGDCGNVYESIVDFCPNQQLDQASVDLRSAKYKADSQEKR
jgi:hypothetical protein